jgi:hypothetical protein
LTIADDVFVIFRDHVTGLEYIRNSRTLSEEGLYIELAAYKYQVFMDFREVRDNEWHQYAGLEKYLDGKGVKSIEETFTEIVLQPVRQPFKELVSPEIFQKLLKIRSEVEAGKTPDLEGPITEVEMRAGEFFNQVSTFTDVDLDGSTLSKLISNHIETTINLPILFDRYTLPRSRNYRAAMKMVLSSQDRFGPLVNGSDEGWCILLGWAITRYLGMTQNMDDYEEQSHKMMDDWLLGKLISQTMLALGVKEEIVNESPGLIQILVRHQNWHLDKKPIRGRGGRILKRWIDDPGIRDYLQINRFSGVYWFNKEAMETLLRWMLTIGSINIFLEAETSGGGLTEDGPGKEIAGLYSIVKKINVTSEDSEFQVKKLLDGVG